MTDMLGNVDRVFRHLALPLVSYYVVTLVLPLANGAAQAGRSFATHALIVLVVPVVAILAACAFLAIARLFTSHGTSHKAAS